MSQAQLGYDTLARQRAFQMLNREWRPHFTLSERDLLFYLFDCTVSWGNDAFTTTTNRLLNGSKTTPGCGLSRATLFRTMESLRKKGVVTTIAGRRYTRIILNLGWEPDMPILPKSKRQQRAEQDAKVVILDDFRDEIRVSKRDSNDHETERLESQIETLYNSNLDTQENCNLRETRDGGRLRAEEAIIKAKAPRPEAKAKAPRSGVVSLRSVWKDAWVATFTDACPVWSRREEAMMKRILPRLVEGGIDPKDFLNTTVCRWGRVRSERFSWMKDNPAPAKPAVGFLVRFLTEFIEFYATLKMDEARSTDFSAHATVKHLVSTGKTYDEAIMIVAEEHGLAAKRGDLAERERKLNERMRKADQRTSAKQFAERAPSPKMIESQGENVFEDPNFVFKGLDLPEWED